MIRIFLFSAFMVFGGLVFTGCRKQAAAGPQTAPIAQVVVVEAKRQPVSETLAQVGTITANEMVELKAETEGIIQDIQFNEGERVEKGQLLIQLDESKLAALVAEAEANFKLSRANYDRSQQLLKDKLIAQQEFDQAAAIFQVNQAGLELKRRQLKDAKIFAPFAGVIGARNISPGQVMTRNTTLTWLVDLDPVKVEMNVPERFLSQLKIGQAIEFPIAAYAGKKFKGRVYFIAPFVDPATRTALIKALIPNPDFQLKPGMFASLELTLKIREQAIVIPEVAISQILDDDRANIYIVDGAQTAQLKTVKLGVRLPRQVEVVSGLEGGEKVIVEGIQKVGPGAKVNLAPPEDAAPYLQTEIRPAPPPKG